MMSLVCMVGLMFRVCGATVSNWTPKEECVTISSNEQCNVYNITCEERVIMVTYILFAETKTINGNTCPKCLTQGYDQLVNVSGGRYDFYMNIILERCSLRNRCSFRPLIEEKAPYVISIKYMCVSNTSIINACGGQSPVLNIGQQIHLNLRNYNTYKVCSCAIKGSTKLKIQDFFTRFEKTFDGPYTLSKSVLWLSGLAFDKSNNSNIVHSDYDHLNVSSIIIIFDNIFHRLWLSVNVTDAAGDGSSVILFLTGGSFAFVSVLAITGIVVYRRRRRKEADKSPMAPETYPMRLRAIDSLGFQNVSMQDAVDSNNACQTVANIPRITRGSAEYAVSMPPGTYSYALTYHTSSASETIKSMSEQTGSSKTDVILADAEEGICNPYFILLPLNEQEIGATKDDSCTDYSVCGADDDRSVAPINAEQSMHVYNHIMLGRGATEGDNENDIRCADDYSHISIDGVNAIGNGRYYNIVNINAGRSEPVDDYCHIGPNNASFHAHVTRDDYNHIVL